MNYKSLHLYLFNIENNDNKYVIGNTIAQVLLSLFFEILLW